MSDREPCRYHAVNGEALCTARFIAADRPITITCTRQAGHDGDHVACGKHGHRVAQWPPAAPGNEVGAKIAHGHFIVSGTVVA